MATETEVCNLALLRCGKDTIANLQDGSRAAELCTVLLPICVDAMLRDFPWTFARKRVGMALLEEEAPTNWSYAYQMPTDCIQALALVVPGMRVLTSAFRVPYEVAGGKLFTDIETPELIYTARVDLPMWDPLAVSALAWLLCSELATPLSLKPDQANQARQAYMMTRSSAAAQSLQEGWEGVEPNGDFLSGRGFSG